MSLMRSGMTDKDGVIKGLREQLVSKEREIESERERAELEREKLSEMNDQLHNIELLEKQLKKQEEKVSKTFFIPIIYSSTPHKCTV